MSKELITTATKTRNNLTRMISDLKTEKGVNFERVQQILLLLLSEINIVRLQSLDANLRQKHNERWKEIINAVNQEIAAEKQDNLSGAEEENDILNNVKKASAETREVFEKIYGNISKTGRDVFSKITNLSKDWAEKQSFTADFNAKVYEELRKRNWKDSDINTALEVFHQTINNIKHS
jgi:hypothetical protein